MELLFWSLVTLILFVVFGYGLTIVTLARLCPDRPPPPPPPLQATLLIAAHNEEGCIGMKIANTLAQSVGLHSLSVCVVSDGSTDRTVEIVRACTDPRVSVVAIDQHVGKIAAMNQALQQIAGDVVIFSDANSRFVPGALEALLRWFGDPGVGGVCGGLAISQRRSGWLGRAERLYWLYDNALKAAESRLGGAVSAQGALYAVRRRLIRDVPQSVADDFFISTEVVAAGFRLVFEPAALSIEEVSKNTRAEFGRRVRSTERGWRGLLHRRQLLDPRRHGAYALQLLAHKFLRRMMPLMLLILVLLSAVLAGQHRVYEVLFISQMLFYGAALAVLLWPPLRRLPGASLPFFFTETQVAMALGLWRVASGRHSRRWTPARDDA